ncbi:MAG: DUF2911 domain-containing protein [Terriglobales bacterium]|jgi:hypothetical protein
MKKFGFVAVALFAIATLASAQMGQDKSKRPSPPASAECKFSDGKTIKIDYSSPRAKGRKIFGEATDKALVPYGEIWRTGANEATKFVTDTNVTLGGKTIPAGSYTLFTIPKADKWTLIINKKTAEWGIPYKYEADELARVDMQVSKTAAPVENFTISFEPTGNKCRLHMEWENTRASIEITK